MAASARATAEEVATFLLDEEQPIRRLGESAPAVLGGVEAVPCPLCQGEAKRQVTQCHGRIRANMRRSASG